MFDIFIKRPVLAMVVSLLILLVGLKSLTELPIRQFPELFNTVITITTTLPGADADLIQGFITDPISRSVSTTKGIDYLTAKSIDGVSTISIHVQLNADPDAAMTDATAKVNEVRSALPSSVDDPIVEKSTGASTSPVWLAFVSENMTGRQVTDYLTRVVQPLLATVPGVAGTEIWGGQTFAMRIWLDPVAMAKQNLSADEVRAAIEANNFLATAGNSKGVFDIVSTSARTDLRSEEEFRDLVVRNVGSQLVRLRDIAEVELGAESTQSAVFVDGKPTVYIGIRTTPEANPLTVSTAIRDRLPALQRSMPAGLTVAVDYDTTTFIRASIAELMITLAEAAVIVMLVIYLFTGSLRSIAIPFVTIPLSLAGAWFFILLCGFSVNLLTLLAMLLAIGLVVDDAIVVVENVHRHIEEGRSPFNAALIGTREIAGPVISMTITLAAVYAPIAFMSGLTGALFSEFALALAGSVVVSGIVALTLAPMMCAQILRPAKGGAGLAALIDGTFRRLRGRYERLLQAVLADRLPVIVFALIIFASLPFLLRVIPTELAPEEDKGYVMFAYSGPVDANLDFMNAATRSFPERFNAIPGIEATFVGNGGSEASSGFGWLTLAPWEQRDRGQQEIIWDAQAILDSVPAVKGSAYGSSSLPGADGLPVAFVVSTTADFRSLYEGAQQLLQAAQESGLFAYVDMDLKIEKPRTVIEIDRDKAAAYGVSMKDIANTLALLTGGDYVSLINLGNRSYKVITQVPRLARLYPAKLGEFHIRTDSGGVVPLSSLITTRGEIVPRSLNQFNQQNATTITGIPAPGVTLGTALDWLASTAQGMQQAGFSYDYSAQSRQYIQEGNSLFLTFLFALVTIFLVLSAQFGSFRDPLVILVSVPLSICGALIPLALGYATMNIYTQVGLVTLIGLISKHGILICEAARVQQEANGLDRRAAVAAAAAIRLRPILMTTAAMVSGLVPLLLVDGAGAQSRFSIAVVIVSGMAIGTLFTLFVLPVIYTFLATDRTRQVARNEEALA